MPYIKSEDDGHPEGTLRQRRKPKWIVAENEGELNYAITCLLNDYMMYHGLEYGWMGDCTAACENAAAEFRRRVMAPYEDRKIEENGDVYDLALTRTPTARHGINTNTIVETPADEPPTRNIWHGKNVALPVENPAIVQPSSASENLCVCGHGRYEHIYYEGACRPGYVCAKHCRKFENKRFAGSGN